MTEPNSSFVRPRVAAGVLFLNESEHVLLVVPSYKDFLDLPGGYVEPGESPRAAAQREVREELGIEPPVGQLLVADWWHNSADGPGGPKLLFVFDGGYLPQSERDLITVDGAEVTDYRFHAVPELPSVTIPRLANRIEHAVAARQDGTTKYLENGHPVTLSTPTGAAPHRRRDGLAPPAPAPSTPRPSPPAPSSTPTAPSQPPETDPERARRER